MKIKQILQHKVIGIVADEDEGKTNTMFYLMDEVLRNKKPVACYFYHSEYRKMFQHVQQISTLDELEQLRDTFIFIDEFKELFQLENRKFWHMVERVFNLLLHNNNVIVLCGVPNYYRKFIASKVKLWLIKGISFQSCVNGSALKEYVMALTGDYVGSTRLAIPKNKVLIEGVFHDVPHLKRYDKKLNNLDLFHNWSQ